WTTFVASSALPWSLPPGDGEKTVYARFKDAAGNVSAPVSGTIRLLATPPTGGSVTIEGGAPVTSKSTVSLDIFATGAKKMLVLVDGEPDGDWVDYGTSAEVSLDATQGNRVISVRFRNEALVEGGGASSSIVYDTEKPPTPRLVLHGTRGDGLPSTDWATSNVVLAEVSVDEASESENDAVAMALWELKEDEADCAFPEDALWQPFAPTTTLVLTDRNGGKTICVALRDQAENISLVSSAGIKLDTYAPNAPAFADLSNGVTNDSTVTARLVTPSVDPSPGSTVSYECFSTTQGGWQDCDPFSEDRLRFDLTANRPNVIAVRARDDAYNRSDAAQVSILQDSTPPFPPNLVELRTTSDSLSLDWQPSADPDIDSFLVYYGNAAGDYAGSGAAQGASPIRVAASGAGLQSFTLTGLGMGRPYYVAVAAVDSAGNDSGPSGQRFAVPNKVNPRALSSIGGRPRSVAGITSAAGGKTFAYLTENQAIVQLDVTSDWNAAASSAPAPVVVGRATLPGLVPDPKAQPAVMSCSRRESDGSTVEGHCVVVAGSTLEGDFRNDADRFRAPTPVVFFPLDGTLEAPALGRVESVLPVRAYRVFAVALGEAFGMEEARVVVALERDRVSVFSLEGGVSFPHKLAEAALPQGFDSIVAAGMVETTLYFLALPTSVYADPYPPVLYSVDVAAPAGSVQYLGTLDDHRGITLGEYGYGGVEPIAAFFGGLFVGYVVDDGNDQILYVARYAPGYAQPVEYIEAMRDPDGLQITGVAGAGGRLYFAGARAMGEAFVQQVTFEDGELGVGLYSTVPRDLRSAHVVAKPGADLLLTVYENLARASFGLDRHRVSGSSMETLGNRYVEVTPGPLAIKDHLLFVAQGDAINTIDFSNPLNPRVVAGFSLDSDSVTYRKLVVHGRYLFAAAFSYQVSQGIDMFEIQSTGRLEHRKRLTPAASVNDFVVVGHWVFAAVNASSASLVAWSVADPAAPSPAGAANVGGIVEALDARFASSGGVGDTAMIYAAFQNKLRTYRYQAATQTFLPLSPEVPLPMPAGMVPHSVQTAGSSALVSFGWSSSGSGSSGTVALSVEDPAYPLVFADGGLLPVAGTVLQQGGYAVGLGPSGSPHGPLFATFAGGDNSANGAIDGTLLYSTCTESSGQGGLAHANGVYFASCRRNGIIALAVPDRDGGRLLRRHDVSGRWRDEGAALAGDGTFHAFGGAELSGSANRLYTVMEMDNTGLAPASPSSSNSVEVSYYYDRFAAWMLFTDGITWAFTDEIGTSRLGLEAYETANPTAVWPRRASVTLATAGQSFAAEPVTDGEFAYVAGSANRIDVYDLRNPAALSGTPAAYLTVTGEISALGLGRDRLYVGRRGSPFVQVYTAAGKALATDSTFRVETVEAITGIALSGRYFFYTYKAQAPDTWGMGVVLLAESLGVPATQVGTYTTCFPLANPIVSGDTLFVSHNLGVATFDLGPLFREGRMPVAISSSAVVDVVRTGKVKLSIEGPFGYLVGGGYRAFDLR
ncbi:MAG: fibronectin type III domain-containing protein, partial [Myxococcales bacterium]